MQKRLHGMTQGKPGNGLNFEALRLAIGEDRVTFREACEYSDGGRIVVETTLEVREGKIVRQVDVVARDPPAKREGEVGPSSATRRPQPSLRPGAKAFPSDHLLRFQRATEKEDL
jgi:hypothetical protein